MKKPRDYVVGFVLACLVALGLGFGLLYETWFYDSRLKAQAAYINTLEEQKVSAALTASLEIINLKEALTTEFCRTAVEMSVVQYGQDYLHVQGSAPEFLDSWTPPAHANREELVQQCLDNEAFWRSYLADEFASQEATLGGSGVPEPK